MDDFELNMQAAKARVWRRLDSRLPERGVGVYQEELRVLRTSAEAVSSSRLQVVQHKERLLDALPDRPEFHFLPTLKRGLAASILSLMSVTLVLPALEPQPVLAAHSNALEPLTGLVTLNGQTVHEKTIVFPGDRVVLGDGAMAHLYFSDGSRVTFGEDSIAVIRELRTRHQIALSEGSLWAQTLDARNSNPRLFLETRDGTIGLYPHSSLDLETDSAGTSVRVAENLARADLSSSRRLTLGPGAALDLNAWGAVHVSNVSEHSDPWWDFNLAFGLDYQEEVLAMHDEQQALQAHVLPGDLLYPIKTLSEEVKIRFSLNADSRDQALVASADQRLLEAQTLFEQGRSDEAQVALDRYQVIAKQVQSPDTQALISARYSDASLLLASETQRPQLRLEQASQKITILPQILTDGRSEEARAVLQEYQAASEAAFKDIDAIPIEHRKELVLDLLDQRVQDWEILKVSEALPEGKDLVNVQAQMLSDLNYMTLSLQTESVNNMSGLVSAEPENAQAQGLLLEQLQNNQALPQDIVQAMTTVRDEITDQSVHPEAPVVSIDLEALPHSNESEQDSESGK